MAFTTKQLLDNAKFYQATNATLDLSGNTKFGNAVYLSGMSASYNAKTIPDVKFVTGQTANLALDIDYISGVTKSNYNKFTGYTATTSQRLQGIEGDIDFISGKTAENTADISALAAVSGFTTQAITGVTNGLTKVGAHSARLGGPLTQATVFTGSTVNHLKYQGDYSAGWGLQSIPDYQSIVTMKSSAITSSFTLTLPMLGQALIVSNASPVLVTVPTNVSVPFPIGSTITIQQGGAGVVTVTGATVGVTLTGVALSTTQQYGFIQLWKTGTDAWTVIGGALELWEAVGNILTPVDTNQRVPVQYISGLTGTLSGVTTGATNGLYTTAQKTGLGGTLCKNTNIGGAGLYAMSLTGLTNLNLGFSGIGTITDSSLSTPAGLCYGGDYSAYFGANSLVSAKYVTGLTNTLSGRVGALEAWSATTEPRIDFLASWSATTESRLDNYDIWTGATQPIINNAFTGVTNGLTEVSAHCIKLGGALTETTNLYGSQILRINVDRLELSGVTNGIRLSGTTCISQPANGVGDVLTWNPSTGAIEKTTMASLGGLTGATNGLGTDGLNACLGGALSADTSICGGSAWDLCLGTSTSKLDYLRLNAKTCTGIITGDLGFTSSGATFTDARPSTSRAGIVYAGDYSTSFTDESLVTKRYVDTVATGLQVHATVAVATTGPITLSGGTGATSTVDGIALSANNRVLVKNQATSSRNGIYVYNASGYTRASDYNFLPPTEIANGDLIPVFTGVTNANTLWVLTTPDPIGPGTGLTFSLFSQTIDVLGSSGITVQMVGALHYVSVNLGTNSGLCLTPSQICVGAGNGLSTAGMTLNINAANCGSVSAIPVGYNAGDCLVVANADILGVLAGTGALTGATNGLGTTSSNKVCLGGTLISGTTITGNYAAGCGLIYSDAAITNKRGIQYGGDYCATFIDQSLVDKAYVVRYATGLTSGLDARLDVIEPIYVTGATGCITKYDAHNVCLETTSQFLLNNAITGATNGLNKSGKKVLLGGALTQGTNVGLNGNTLRISGGTTCTTFNATSVEFNVVCESAYVCLSDVAGNGSIVASVNTGNTGISIAQSGDNIGLYTLGGATLDLTAGSTFAVAGVNDVTLDDNGGNYMYLLSSAGNSFELNSQGNVGIVGDGNASTLSLTADGMVSNILVSPGFVDFTNNTLNILLAPNAGGGADDVLLRDVATGEVKIISVATLTGATNIGAENGLNRSGNMIRLGGDLTGTTIINLQGFALCITDTTSAVNMLQVDEAIDVVGMNTVTGGFIAVDGVNDLASITTAANGYLQFYGTAQADCVVLSSQAGAYVGILGGSDCITISTDTSPYLSLNGTAYTATLSNCSLSGGAWVNLTGNTINLSGYTKLQTVPQTGSISDSVLVRAATGEIKTVAGANLGDKNNFYSRSVVTGATATLTSGSSYVILVSGASLVTLSLPTTGVALGQAYKIKDISGNALSNNIIVNAGTGRVIDNAQCALINTDFGALEVMLGATCKWYSLSFVN
jgi:parallel beta-helix repeat protein